MSEPTIPPSVASVEGIREYQIHASTRSLRLTQEKLSIARLPHEVFDATTKAWWNPKPVLEPLIDFWLEQFSWRDLESDLNQSVPQFRINVKMPGIEGLAKIHFIHARSRHPNAVPLMLMPPFPFTNLCFRHITDVFTEPNDANTDQPFHLVMPSLPGLGFSDPLPDDVPPISKISELLDILMQQLGYKHYIATNSGSSVTPQGGIDWKIINHLAANYSDSCLGVHLVSPPLEAPRALKAPVEWLKLTLAKTLKTSAFGYSKDDITALQKNERKGAKRSSAAEVATLGSFSAGAYDANTMAYALCDSPTGVLVFFLTLIRILESEKEFTASELVTMAKLTWIPGPEGTVRLWAADHLWTKEGAEPASPRKPKASITVFVADEMASQNNSAPAQEHAPSIAANSYVCPVWGRQHYDVVWAGRVQGKQGLLAWERPQVIADGARSLAKALLAVDRRLYGSEHPENTTA